MNIILKVCKRYFQLVITYKQNLSKAIRCAESHKNKTLLESSITMSGVDQTLTAWSYVNVIGASENVT